MTATHLVELADDWHPRGYRLILLTPDGTLPHSIPTVAVDLTRMTRPTLTGEYLRTGTADDGVPVFAWVPRKP